MSFIGNVIWLLAGGVILAAVWAVAGLLLCVTIIGIPFGLQCLKIAGFVLWPFGRDIELGNFGAGGFLLNLIWVLVFGIELAVAHLFVGIVFCVTMIGIPFGLQHFKLAKLSFMPFGARIYMIG